MGNQKKKVGIFPIMGWIRIRIKMKRIRNAGTNIMHGAQLSTLVSLKRINNVNEFARVTKSNYNRKTDPQRWYEHYAWSTTFNPGVFKKNQ